MTVTNYKELIKRIARLARQNQELDENIRKLEKINEQLRSEIEEIRAHKEKVSTERIKEKSLKIQYGDSTLCTYSWVFQVYRKYGFFLSDG